MVSIRLLLIAILLCAGNILQAQTYLQQVSGSGCTGDVYNFVLRTSCSSVSWSAPGGQILSQGASGMNVRYDNPGIYNVSVIYSGCSSNPTSGTEFSPNVVVSAPLTPSVSISGTSTICQGSSVTFTATPTNGGSSPLYTWKVNGATVYTGGIYFTTTSLVNGDVVTAVLSTGSCVKTSPASNPITITVTPPLPLSVTIGGSPMPLCSGSGSFGATPFNAVNPTYTWYRNGLPANNRATGTPDFAYTGNTPFNNNDVITCVVSSDGCVSGSPATSNQIIVSTVSPTTPAVGVGPSSNLCTGSNITFTATPGGSGYTLSNFSWKLNNVSVPGNTNEMTTTQFSTGSSVTVSATASGSCLSTTSVTGTTSPNIQVEQSANPSISPSGSLTISSTSSQTISASPTSGYNYSWTKDGSPIGGNNSTYTTNQPGVYTVGVNRNGCTWFSSSLTLSINSAPIVSITSSNQTLTLPTTIANLSGAASDSDGSIVSSYWSQVSGPKQATFSNQTSPSTTVNGLTMPGSYIFQLIVTDNFGEYAYSNLVTLTVVLPTNNYNWVSEQSVLKSGVTTPASVDALTIGDKIKTIHYFDDLGRDMQTVAVQSSTLHKDVVQPIAYDNDGRTTTTYLPYSDSSDDGTYKSNALADPLNTGTDVERYQSGAQYQFYQSVGTIAGDQSPFAETRFEASPLNRIIKQGAPGAAWQPDADQSYTSTDHTVKKTYEANEANEILLWTYIDPTPEQPLGTISAFNGTTLIYYATNNLYRNRTKDEHQNEVIEYVDKEGRLICKKVQYGVDASSNKLYTQTYYIYNDFGELVIVLPPEAVKLYLTEH